MSKLLYIHNTDVFNTTANLTQVVSMCNAFSKCNVNTTLLLPANKKKQQQDIYNQLTKTFKLAPQLTIGTFKNPFTSYKINKTLNFISLFRHLKKQKGEYDYVFVRSVQYACVAMILGFKVIYESHNTLVHNGSKLYNWFLTKVLVYISKKQNHVLFVSISDNLNNFWVNKGIPKAKTISLHDGFNPEAYTTNITKAQSRQKHGFNGDKPIVIYTGNIHPNRGINYILESAAMLRNLDFHIVGGPISFLSLYEAKMNELNLTNVFFRGQVNHDVIPEYQVAADVLIAVWSKDVPTINYCSPLKIFEYMASKTPVVAFGYPSVREVLQNNLNACVVNPDSVSSLIEGIEKVLSDPNYATTITDNAAKHVHENYTWESRVYSILGRLTNN